MTVTHLSTKALLKELARARAQVHVGEHYVHYRYPNNLYQVVGLTIIEATQSVGVLYKKVSSTHGLEAVVWMRPLSSWVEQVDGIPRFTPQK